MRLEEICGEISNLKRFGAIWGGMATLSCLETSIFFWRASYICSKCLIESGLFALTQFLEHSV